MNNYLDSNLSLEVSCRSLEPPSIWAIFLQIVAHDEISFGVFVGLVASEVADMMVHVLADMLADTVDDMNRVLSAAMTGTRF